MLRKSKMKRRNTEPSLAGSDSTSSSDRRRVAAMIDKDNERLEKLLIAENE